MHGWTRCPAPGFCAETTVLAASVSMPPGLVNLELLAKRPTVSTWVDKDGQSGTLLAGRASQVSRLTAIRTRITMIINF